MLILLSLCFSLFSHQTYQWKLQLFKKSNCEYCDIFRSILRRIKYIFVSNVNISIVLKECSYSRACIDENVYSVPQLILQQMSTKQKFIYHSIPTVESVYNWIINLTNIIPTQKFIQFHQATEEMASVFVDKGNCVFALLGHNSPPLHLYTDLDTYAKNPDFIPIVISGYQPSLFSAYIKFGLKVQLLNISAVENFISHIDHVCYGSHRTHLREYVQKLINNETIIKTPKEFKPHNPENALFAQKLWSDSLSDLYQKLYRTQITTENNLSKEMRNQLKQRNLILMMMIELKLSEEKSEL